MRDDERAGDRVTSQELVDYDWLIPSSGRPSRARLHHARVGQGLSGYDDTAWGDVTAACGRVLPFAVIPGVFSRMSVPRCAKCCDVLGYPRGVGSPKNDDRCRELLGLKVTA